MGWGQVGSYRAVTGAAMEYSAGNRVRRVNALSTQCPCPVHGGSQNIHWGELDCARDTGTIEGKALEWRREIESCKSVSILYYIGLMSHARFHKEPVCLWACLCGCAYVSVFMCVFVCFWGLFFFFLPLCHKYIIDCSETTLGERGGAKYFCATVPFFLLKKTKVNHITVKHWKTSCHLHSGSHLCTPNIIACQSFCSTKITDM